MRINPKDQLPEALNNGDKKIDDQQLSKQLALILAFVATFGIAVKVLFF